MSIKLPGVTFICGDEKEANDFLQDYATNLALINEGYKDNDSACIKHSIQERSRKAAFLAATVLPEDSMGSFFLNSQEYEDDYVL